MAGKQYIFVLSFGYAESQSIGAVAFTSEDTFATAKHALIDLAHFFKELCEGELNALKKCCGTNKVNNPDAAFCAKCGNSLKEPEFDVDNYIDFVRNIDGESIDSYAQEYISGGEDARWDFISMEDAFSQSSKVRFVYETEKVFAAALGHSPDDRIDIDKIFSRRTAAKDKSFSFWG